MITLGKSSCITVSVTTIVLLAMANFARAQTFSTVAVFPGCYPADPLPRLCDPDPQLIQATDGNLYGNSQGGQAYYGEFKLSPSGTLERFPESKPVSVILETTNGYFYGFGAGNDAGHYGSIARINPGGKATLLYTFSGGDGEAPAGMIQGADGNLYGTTSEGGPNICSPGSTQPCGTVFKITPSGKLTTLHIFSGPDGYFPTAGLVQGTDGNFYGTTYHGGQAIGSGGCGNDGCGTVFMITAQGEFTSLYQFADSGPNGQGPSSAPLVQGSDGTSTARVLVEPTIVERFIRSLLEDN
jgi:uncharacterized repeat protein (TIGR03803 family)